MVTIAVKPERRDRAKALHPSRYQMKIALSYMAIILVMLIFLNTYPVWISQNFVFTTKKATMGTQANQLTTTLSGLDSLNESDVARVMAVMDDGSYRVLVCDHTGLVVYDNAPAESTVGQYALMREVVQALGGSSVIHSLYRDGAFDSRYAAPIIVQGTAIGALYLGETDTAQAALLDGLLSNLVTVSLLIFIVVLFFSLFISIALTRRLGELLHSIRSACDNRYDYKVNLRGRDELTEIGELLNRLTDILQKTEELRQSFVSNASHELKTPLASVRLLTDSILQNQDMPPETIREFVTDIAEESERLSRMTEKLMLLSRLESVTPELSLIDPQTAIRRAVRMLEPLAERAGLTIGYHLTEGCHIYANDDDLYQIVFNLMDNAIKYNKPGGEAQALLYKRDVEVYIVVRDSGVGIPAEAQPLLFDRFYRVDKARSRDAGGSGLGLSIVSDTVQRLGGSIRVDSEPGRGTSFIVSFPIAGQEDGHED